LVAIEVAGAPHCRRCYEPGCRRTWSCLLEPPRAKPRAPLRAPWDGDGPSHSMAVGVASSGRSNELPTSFPVQIPSRTSGSNSTKDRDLSAHSSTQLNSTKRTHSW
jgi:hypothetical protein